MCSWPIEDSTDHQILVGHLQTNHGILIHSTQLLSFLTRVRVRVITRLHQKQYNMASNCYRLEPVNLMNNCCETRVLKLALFDCTSLLKGFAAHSRDSKRFSHSASLVDFSPIVMPAPKGQPSDLTVEDFSTLNAVYSFPISPEHMPTVIAAYSASISKNTKYLVQKYRGTHQ